MVARGDRAGAVEEQRGFEEARAKVPADSVWGNNRAADVLGMAGEILAARVADSPALAVPHWERAVAMQDALVYDEPPAWYYPVRESLGAALLRAGRASDAEAVFREGIARVPRNGRMLFGLMESLRAQGKNGAAELVKREFDAAWQKADVKLIDRFVVKRSRSDLPVRLSCMADLEVRPTFPLSLFSGPAGWGGLGISRSCPWCLCRLRCARRSGCRSWNRARGLSIRRWDRRFGRPCRASRNLADRGCGR